MTLGDRLKRTGGRPAGFDVLRLGLAAAVIIQHGVNVTQGQAAADALFRSGWRALFEPVLPMFFALSGFLVAGSLFRCRSLIGFCGLRLLRIVPALAVEVGLSALLLGPLLTVLPLAAYVADPAFGAYLLNIFGLIHYELPGVFLTNPDPRTVNAQLWTVPYELECYLALAGLAMLGLPWRRLWFVAAVVALQILLVCAMLTAPATLEITVPGRALVLCFLAGVALFLFKERIPWHGGLFLLAAGLGEALLWMPGGSALVAWPAAYATIYLGLLSPPKPAFLFDGDYSYGLYLYGFPIQQTLASLWPGMPAVVNAFAALLLAFGFAQLSWRLVERRALMLRPTLHRIENGVLARLPQRLLPLLGGAEGETAARLSRA